jgi:guanylate kinase
MLTFTDCPFIRFFLINVMICSIRSFCIGRSTGFRGGRSAVSNKTQTTCSSSSLDAASISTCSLSSQQLVLDPLIICGPSGVGKGTVIQKFMTDYNGSSRFGFTVSHTTRAPRAGEIDGVHYHFTTMDTFNDTDNDFFIESAHVHGNYYGTSWNALQDVQASGRKCLLDIDVQGVRRIKALPSRDDGVQLIPRYVFIAPPSLSSLQERLIGRGTETEESLRTRLGNAKGEVDYGQEPGNFDAVIVNDNLERAVQELHQVVAALYEDL